MKNRFLSVLFAISVSVPGTCSVSAGAEDVIDEETYLAPSVLSDRPIREIEIVAPGDIVSKETSVAAVAGEARKAKVRPGDTLYSIARAYDVKVYELAAHNKIAAPFVLKPGQTLEIPPAAEPRESQQQRATIIENLDRSKTFIETPKVDFVEVKKGDTIYSIAKGALVPLKDLILRNGMEPPYTISIGQKIYLPSIAFHIVKKQDTLYSISRRYGVNLNSLAKLNSIEEPYGIAEGQKLILPAPNVESASAPKAILEKPEAKPKVVEVKRPAPPVPPPAAEEEVVVEEREAKSRIETIIARPEPMSRSKFLWPVEGKVISEFGLKTGGKRNDGINISAMVGTKVRAAENGIVAYAGNELKGLGNLVILRHSGDYMTIYAHNDSISVGKGESVARGDTIASVGKTGRVTVPQLHFEIRQKAKSLNPVSMLEKK